MTRQNDRFFVLVDSNTGDQLGRVRAESRRDAAVKALRRLGYQVEEMSDEHQEAREE